MKIHNKNLRESGEWEDYTDGADMYSPEFEQQQELTELERERFDSLSLAGQIAEVTGKDAEEIQIVLDEAAENDYPNQVVLESLQEILGISEDEMIRTVLPILKNHGFEGDYTADHYDIDDEEEDVIFESVRKNSKNRKMSESYAANRGSLRKSYAELHPEVKENMREGVNSISFNKTDRNNVEATFDTDDGVHVENYDTHRAVGIARDWVRKGYVCKVNGEPVDDPTVFDDCSDEGEMTCTASWRKQESSKVKFLRKKYNEARSSTARRYYSERLKEETSREKNRRLNERFSSAEEERDAVEKFCILMDWEVKPEDVLHCVKNSDNTFTLQTENGDQFTYDPVKDCLRESQKRSILATKNRRITEAYSANRGSATKSYAEMHPEMKENSKVAFLKKKFNEAKSREAKRYYSERLKEERVREASYQKFELPKKATPGDKDYNPDEPGKKPAKRDWTSGKMKSVNGIYGRRAWTTKEPKSK